jgi:hypothetical protein
MDTATAGIPFSSIVSGALIAGFFVCLAVFLFSGKASAAETSSPNPVSGSVTAPVAGSVQPITAPVAGLVGQVTTPVTELVQPIAAPVAGLVGQVTTPVAGLVQPTTTPGGVGPMTFPVTVPSYTAGAGAFVQSDAPGGAGLWTSTSGAPTSVRGDGGTVLPPVTPAPQPIPPGSGSSSSSSSSASASAGSSVGLLSEKPTVGADLVGWLGRSRGNVLPETYIEPEESPA